MRKCASLRKVFDGSNASQRTFGDVVEECLIADMRQEQDVHSNVFSQLTVRSIKKDKRD